MPANSRTDGKIGNDVDPSIPLDELLKQYYRDPYTVSHLSKIVDAIRPQVCRRIQAKGVSETDAEDIVASAMLRLVDAIESNRTSRVESISNISAYSQRVADSVFEDYLRSLKPNWYRLKRRIVYLLDGRAGRKVLQGGV